MCITTSTMKCPTALLDQKEIKIVNKVDSLGTKLMTLNGLTSRLMDSI